MYLLLTAAMNDTEAFTMWEFASRDMLIKELTEDVKNSVIDEHNFVTDWPKKGQYAIMKVENSCFVPMSIETTLVLDYESTKIQVNQSDPGLD